MKNEGEELWEEYFLGERIFFTSFLFSNRMDIFSRPFNWQSNISLYFPSDWTVLVEERCMRSGGREEYLGDVHIYWYVCKH
jgi:hypothetical protein